MAWQTINPKGELPPARNAHTMNSYKKYLILFGGHNGIKHLNDLWTFEINNNTWTKLELNSDKPVGLRGHTANLIDDNIYIFAGYDGHCRYTYSFS